MASTTMNIHRLAPRGVPPPPDLNLGKGIRKLTKSTRACTKCRSLRRRCDGGKPCSNCVGLPAQCDYAGTDRRKKEDWKARLEALEQRNAYLEDIVGQLTCNKSAASATDSTPPHPTPPSTSESEFGPNNPPTTGLVFASERKPVLTAESCSILAGDQDLEHIFCAATAAHPLLGSLTQTKYARGTHAHGGNRRDELPEERLTRKAVDEFFCCVATLFYVINPTEADQLIKKVYHSNEATVQDVCELAALAAFGSHYNVEEIPIEARASYFFIASTSLNEAIQANYIQGMRIFICLCMSCVMDKSSSARLLIVSALNLARAGMEADLQKTMSSESQDAYRRTLQTLIFLEGWLSYSLGYRNCLKKSEIDLISHIIPLYNLYNNTADPETAKTHRIQSQITKLTLIASGIQDEMAHYQRQPQCDYWAHADELAGRLDKWFRDLPADLHLISLNTERQTVPVLQERALYLMHMLYIDMRLQLYCQLFKASQQSQSSSCASAQIQGRRDSNPSLEKIFSKVPQHISDLHTGFAIQLARIVSLLYNHGAIMTRCWLAIHAIFDTAVVLLLAICQRYFTESQDADVSDLLTYVDTCLRAIRFCSCKDIAAMRLSGMLNSVLDELRMDPLQQQGLAAPPPPQPQVQGPEDEEEKKADSMSIQFILSREEMSPPPEPALARMTRQLLGLMSPRGNVWV
ncbi:hypothetical protein BJX61DRAFT_419542 [Aspergillus egyptiacus]|nr:hypothetical protein BJX61DRAFT_419542 [Aspergillus egyptiacus]